LGEPDPEAEAAATPADGVPDPDPYAPAPDPEAGADEVEFAEYEAANEVRSGAAFQLAVRGSSLSMAGL
jgi:hypothetical protein